MANGNQFYVEPANPLRGLSDVIGAGFEAEGVQRRGDFAKKEMRDKLQKAAGFIKTNDHASLVEFMVMNPELREHLQSVQEDSSETEKIGRIQTYREALTSGNPKQVVEKQIALTRQEGGDTSDLERLLNLEDGEIKDAMLAGLAIEQPQAAKAFMEATGYKKSVDKKIGSPSPKDFTADSLANYEQSGNFRDLKRFRPKVTKIAGVPHQYNPETMMWEPLIDMEGADISAQAKAAAKLEAVKQSMLDFGKEKSKFFDRETRTTSRIASTKASHKILMTTAQLIKDNISNWSTQYGTALNLLPGTEARKLKGLISTMKANSAFGTLISLKEDGGTLGAISTAELTLLADKLGSLDQLGETAELERVLDQITDANQGTIERMENAFSMDRKRYSGSFDDAIKPPLSDEELREKYKVE